MSKESDECLRLRRAYEREQTERAAGAWINAENKLSPQDYDKYMKDWKKGNVQR